MHKRTQTVISLLRFLITVTMGGPPVRIYLSPLLPPILLSPLPRFPRPHPSSFRGVGLQKARAPLSLRCRGRIRETLAAERAYGLRRTPNKPYTLRWMVNVERGDYKRGNEVERKKEKKGELTQKR